ncbi:MAG: hypothetical protein R2851_23890 [Caldilineaceae bacterium]
MLLLRQLCREKQVLFTSAWKHHRMVQEHIRYQLVVRMHLGSARLCRCRSWTMQRPLMHRNIPVTTMTLDVVDQGQLIGLLNQLHGYGLDLLSLNYVVNHHALGTERRGICPN